MEDSRTIAWIFLATALASKVQPAKFSGISMIADGINHAVPTQKELQSSIKWLINKDIILKTNKSYVLSDFGKSIVVKAETSSNLVLQILKTLEIEIRGLL